MLTQQRGDGDGAAFPTTRYETWSRKGGGIQWAREDPQLDQFFLSKSLVRLSKRQVRAI